MSAPAAADATANGSHSQRQTAAPAAPAAVPPHCIAILDAGAQYSKVIDRRVRELKVQSHILPLSTPTASLHGYAAIIISGGPQSVYGDDAPVYDPTLFTEYRGPILGICYGMQLMNYACGGHIQKGGVREDGQFLINIKPYTVDDAAGDNAAAATAAPRRSLLYDTLPDMIEVLLTHGDSLTDLAPGFHTTAVSASSGICASIEHESRPLFGVQYHPEVDLTPEGNVLFTNFLDRVCKIPRTFTLQSREETAIAEIRATVGADSKVLCLLSGGVDSSVCAALLKEAIGADRIIAIHIDNGFMRLNESADVVQALESIGLKIHLIDARQRFYHGRTTVNGVETEELSATLKPEWKRKIIGDTFVRVAEDSLRGFGLDPAHVFLAQGTLRPDLIESASSHASVGGSAEVIKTHHNDTALVRELRDAGRIIEPLKDLHKDEVRLLGLKLGLPQHLVWRQPFPGPGLAVRIICATEPFTTSSDEQIVEKLQRYNTDRIHVSLLACRTVGVQGDSRSYSHLVSLSTTAQATATAHAPNWHSLFHLAKEIPKRVHGVNRVVYTFGAPLTQTHYRTITRTHLSPDAIEQLQRADDIVNRLLLQYDLVKTLSQVPVILFPIDFSQEGEDNTGKRSICLRTFITNDFMTGVPALPAIDHVHRQLDAAESPSPAPSPAPHASSLTPSPCPSTGTPSPSPALFAASAFTAELEPVAAPVAAAEHVPLTSVRFPTMPLQALQQMVTQILAEVPGIARVCYDLTCKPPATTEWE